MDKKRVLGQFFTKDALWLKAQIVDFIRGSGAKIAYDPFAGGGDLLKAAQDYCGFKDVIGLDIDGKLGWKINDSLLEIPSVDDAIIITNPPYISNYSAARKGVDSELKKYFLNSEYTDVYLIALDKMLATGLRVVAIIPETFINSKYQKKGLLHSITILEENPFADTENPVVVACFDNINKKVDEVKLYKNDHFVATLGEIEKLRLKPWGNLVMNFNDSNGWLAVRCVDTTNPADMIRFDYKENIEYDWGNKIKVSSRLLTLISVEVPVEDRQDFIDACNQTLQELREKTSDMILSPFKGNMKDGRRRRRLDFMTCRAIIEGVYESKYVLEHNTQDQVELVKNSAERIENAYQQTLF